MATPFAPSATLPSVRLGAPLTPRRNGIALFFSAFIDSVAEARVMMRAAARKYPFIDS